MKHIALIITKSSLKFSLEVDLNAIFFVAFYFHCWLYSIFAERNEHNSPRIEFKDGLVLSFAVDY